MYYSGTGGGGGSSVHDMGSRGLALYVYCQDAHQ